MTPPHHHFCVLVFRESYNSDWFERSDSHVITLSTYQTYLTLETRDTQEIAYVKYEIWYNGGPAADLQRLFVAGSNEPLDDCQRLSEVLPRGASLQLVTTTPPTRNLSISAVVDPDFTCCAEEFRIPVSDEVTEAAHSSLTGYVQYLGDATVDSTASGDEIAFEVQEQFTIVPLDPEMLIFVLKHDQGGGCAKNFCWIGI